MKYEDALKCWGYQKIKDQVKPTETILMDNIDVYMNFTQGRTCCSGTDPLCYCSLAESPRAEVLISARTTKNRYIEKCIDFGDFDFAGTLREILEAANGSIEL